MNSRIADFIEKYQPKKDIPIKTPIRFGIDNPVGNNLTDRKISLEGWILSEDGAIANAVRVWDGADYLLNSKIIDRPDIEAAFSEALGVSVLKSGFLFEFEYKDKKILLEADFGNGFESVTEIEYLLDQDVATANYNPFMATNWANHLDLLEAKQDYYCESQSENKVLSGKDTPKVIALYLPQYHPIPENDKAWGKGFTEWTNVAAAKPRFVGHRQPMQPTDLGYYDLRVDSIMPEQIALAKQQGIYGFCYYYYWFSGKRALEMPLDKMLKHKEWDFNFMICWANENWTKRWDGLDEEVILEQKYRDDDPIRFIKDVESILLDKRYIRIDNKPVLMVYRPEKINAKKYVKVWREYFRKNYNLELHLVTVWGSTTDDPRIHGFDAAMQFFPGAVGAREGFAENYHVSEQETKANLLDVRQVSTVVNYRKVVKNQQEYLTKQIKQKFPLYECIAPSWDNDARKKGQGGIVFSYENPDIYYKWLKNALEVQNKNNCFTFVNAWNEWAEGTVLEPTSHYGHAVLNRTGDAIAGRDPSFQNVKRTPNALAAIVIHVNAADEFMNNKNLIKVISSVDQTADVYIVVTPTNSHWVKDLQKSIPKAQIIVAPNRGGNSLPFLFLLSRLTMLNYKSVARIIVDQDKESNTSLFKSMKTLNAVLDATNNSAACVVTSYKDNDKGSEEARDLARQLIKKVYGDKDISDQYLNSTPQISNFCSNIKNLEEMAQFNFMPEDFPGNVSPAHKTMEAAAEFCLNYQLYKNAKEKYILKGSKLKLLPNA